jgi:hypothetical protein
MINNLSKKIFFLIPTLASIIFVSVIWEKIKFKFENPSEVIGYYSLFEYSHLNDSVRFIVFISIPLITFFFTIFFLKKESFAFFIKKFVLIKENNTQEKISIFFLFFLFLILLFKFLSSEFGSYPIDLFHEGQSFMGAKNYEFKNKLWSGTYIITSLFIDVFNAKIAWSILKIESIGSYRVYISLITQLATLVIFIFLFVFVNRLNLEKNLKTLIFFVLSFLTFYLVQRVTLGYREIPIFIFFIFLLRLLDTKKVFTIDTIILGALPLIGILWSIDRGVFLIAAYFPLIILLLFNKRYQQILNLSLVILVTLIFFFIIFGSIEFKNFISVSMDVLSFADLSAGLVHPTPFSDDLDATRASKNLLIMLLNGCILISIFFEKNNNFNKNHKIFLVIFYFLSLVFYKVGLTRSDGSHIKSGACLSIILLFYFISFYFFKFLQKQKFFLKIKKNHYKILYSLFFILFILQNFTINSYENISNFKIRYNNYIKINDYNYLNKSEIALINKLKILTKNDNCFQVFTYETAISYFLNKKSCTTFPHILNLGSKKNQLLFIDQMNEEKPKFILTEGTYQNVANMKGRYQIFELTPKDRFPYINNYIKENYKLYEDSDAWKILTLK